MAVTPRRLKTAGAVAGSLVGLGLLLSSAAPEDVAAQVSRCPSGALQYRLKVSR